MDLARLTRVPFFQGMPQWALSHLTEAAAEERERAGGIVLRQSNRAWAVHFLVTGSVQVLVRVGDQDLLVAALADPASCWAGRPFGLPTGTPPRYAARSPASW